MEGHPEDLYDRLLINIKLNENWSRGTGRRSAAIYSYPMRYAPIKSRSSDESSRNRDYVPSGSDGRKGLISLAGWTKRFLRNVEIMKGAASGAISPTPALARRTIGKTFKELVANLYMPEELLRNRNKHEKRVYKHEPKRPPGTGKVEGFRAFILRLIKEQPEENRKFHDAVSPNTVKAVRDYFHQCKNEG